MLEYRDKEKREKDTAVMLNNLDVLVRTFGVTKKEVEQAIGISSGYLTRVANPMNKKNISLDLQLMLERYFGVPQFSLSDSVLELPGSEDEFLINVLTKSYKETERESRKWDVVNYDLVKNGRITEELFGTTTAKDSPFEGREEVIRKTDRVLEEVFLVGDIFKTTISKTQVLLIFKTGIYTGDYETDYDEAGNPYPYRSLDFHYEVHLCDSEGVYRPVADDYNLDKNRQLLKYAIIRLYNLVEENAKRKIERETRNILENYLNGGS